MKYEFEAEIKLLEGKIKWNVFYFPYPVKELFETNGRITVKITVDGYDFNHTLLPSKNGHYLVYNEFIRKAVGKKLGDTVHVTLEKCNEKHKLVIPEYIVNELNKSGVVKEFEKWPDYIKHEEINKIELAKKEETKQNRLNVLIKKL